LSLRRRPNDQLRLHELSNLATRMKVATIVTNDVLFHEPSRRILQDVVTCIRHGVTIDELGEHRERHADRYLKSPEEMHRLFGRYPEALERTLEIVERCKFSLEELAYQYPEERADPSLTPQQTLEKLTWEGAAKRYPEGLPDNVRTTLEHELRLIEKLHYAPYFLTVNSIVRFARSKDILCQGRGSAANSAVCYVLGITSIDPDRNDLLFERFVSEERREPPDIDVDFEHERREIVMQWIFDTYGRDHAALCSIVANIKTLIFARISRFFYNLAKTDFTTRLTTTKLTLRGRLCAGGYSRPSRNAGPASTRIIAMRLSPPRAWATCDL
jgi:error-prone DNA polymerase